VSGDARLAAAGPVVGPTLRQEQVGVQQGVVAAAANAQMHRHDAVVHLAQAAEVLPLDAGRPGAALGGTGFVDQPDTAQVVGRGPGGEQGGGVALQVVAERRPVPGMVAQELLQGAHGGAGPQGDGLDTLARQVGQQALDVGGKVSEGLGVGAAEQEGGKEGGQGRPKVGKLLLRHGGSLHKGTEVS
jgi:hypothetical protein